jgi:hypothetical protein
VEITTSTGLGSGVVYDGNGDIVTNDHSNPATVAALSSTPRAGSSAFPLWPPPTPNSTARLPTVSVCHSVEHGRAGSPPAGHGRSSSQQRPGRPRHQRRHRPKPGRIPDRRHRRLGPAGRPSRPSPHHRGRGDHHHQWTAHPHSLGLTGHPGQPAARRVSHVADPVAPREHPPGHPRPGKPRRRAAAQISPEARSNRSSKCP